MCEIGLVQGEIRWMKQHLGRLCRQKHVRTPLAQFAAKSYQSPSPYGNVLIMSPCNYPVLLTLEPLVDAIAAGNTAVVKPSAYAPASANVLKDLLEECFPPEYVAASFLAVSVPYIVKDVISVVVAEILGVAVRKALSAAHVMNYGTAA